MLHLRTPTKAAWIDAVMANFDRFLLDHAACERKASATGLSFVVRYPDREALILPMIAFAQEELEHFAQVVAFIQQRGLRMTADEKSPYVSGLMGQVRTGRNQRLLDRLLVAGVAEARGCERFGLVAAALPRGRLKEFYRRLNKTEARHHALFVRLAREHFTESIVQHRVDELLDVEAALIGSVPVVSALY